MTGEPGSHHILARLPPLAALRTFEAAARQRRISPAPGAELHITHGAISHQMKALERELGVALFHRRRRGVELTEPGRALATTVREALDRIARGIAELRARPHRALTISVLPAFATHWLIPRLADFNRRHPESTSTCARARRWRILRPRTSISRCAMAGGLGPAYRGAAGA